jgi:Sec-independent protein translocase protein TatA
MSPQIFRAFGALLQLLAIGLTVELLLGSTDGTGILLRCVVILSIMFCIILRLGWLSLVAVQVSLLIQEPRRQPLEQNLSGFLYVLLACCAIVVTMNLPQVHRFVSEFFIRFFLAAADKEELEQTSVQSSPPQIRSFVGSGLAIRVLQMVMSVVLGMLLLTNIPIGQQSSSWLQWSRVHGQAVWPGSLLLVVMIGLLVLARENAWRQFASSQARLYLRSQRLIANGRDLLSFERRRQKQKRNQRLSVQASHTPTTKRTARSKLGKTDLKTESIKKVLQ